MFRSRSRHTPAARPFRPSSGSLDRRRHAQFLGEHPLVHTKMQVHFGLIHRDDDQVDVVRRQAERARDKCFELRSTNLVLGDSRPDRDFMVFFVPSVHFHDASAGAHVVVDRNPDDVHCLAHCFRRKTPGRAQPNAVWAQGQPVGIEFHDVLRSPYCSAAMIGTVKNFSRANRYFSLLKIFVAVPILDFAQADARVPTPRALRVSICYARWQANWSA